MYQTVKILKKPHKTKLYSKLKWKYKNIAHNRQNSQFMAFNKKLLGIKRGRKIYFIIRKNIKQLNPTEN